MSRIKEEIAPLKSSVFIFRYALHHVYIRRHMGQTANILDGRPPSWQFCPINYAVRAIRQSGRAVARRGRSAMPGR
jgi:hypothetical protein